LPENADKGRSLGRSGSLADSGHGVSFFVGPSLLLSDIRQERTLAPGSRCSARGKTKGNRTQCPCASEGPDLGCVAMSAGMPDTSSTETGPNSVALVRERTVPTGLPPLVGEVTASFLRIKKCCVVSATDPYGSILGFLDWSRYSFFQVAPQLYSRG
jgi:hypothetical protein